MCRPRTDRRLLHARLSASCLGKASQARSRAATHAAGAAVVCRRRAFARRPLPLLLCALASARSTRRGTGLLPPQNGGDGAGGGGRLLRRAKAGCVFICPRTSPPLPSFPALLFSLCVSLAVSLPSCSAAASIARPLIPICVLQPKHGEAGGLDKANGLLRAASYLQQRAAQVASEGGVPLKHPSVTPAFFGITCRPHAEPSHTQAAGD